MRQVQGRQVWIGNASDSRNFREIHARGIRALVQLAHEEPCIEAARDLILSRVPLTDGLDNDPALTRLAIGSVLELIRAEIPTLVSCSNGLSRSPCVVAAAVSLIEGLPLNSVLQEVVGTGPADVSPQFWHHVLGVTAAMSQADPRSPGEPS